jgi:hypothetical protein
MPVGDCVSYDRPRQAVAGLFLVTQTVTHSVNDREFMADLLPLFHL